MNAYPLFFSPTFKHRIWGGSTLTDWFPDCPTDEPIGEAWVLSDHPEGETPLRNGVYQGLTLHELIEREPAWFGAAVTKDKRFPLLFKVIDASDDLSIQVHPDDEYGFTHAGEQGKTECWWVLRADPGAKIIYGHTARSQVEFEQRIAAGEWNQLLQEIHPTPGDFLFIPAKKIHALGKGTRVLEIQQSSDTTYRVYDYDRTDVNGYRRALHLTEALEVIPYPDMTVEHGRHPLYRPHGEGEHLVACPYFQVEKWTLRDGVVKPEELTVWSVLDGEARLHHGEIQILVRPGDQVLFPLGVGEVRIEGSISVLTTTIPS